MKSFFFSTPTNSAFRAWSNGIARRRGFTSLRAVPSHIQRPDYAFTGSPRPSPTNTYVFETHELGYMREAAHLARYILDFACDNAKEGMSTDDVDALAHEEMMRKGIYPSPLNYCGFPKSICTSLNTVTCHGIPRKEDVLKKGDKLAIDVSIFHKGYHGDNCKTIIIGHDSDESDADTDNIKIKKKLIHANKEALDAAIKTCGPGKCITDIGAVIEDVSQKYNFEVVKEFCGHGLGSNLHMQPLILHFRHTEKHPLLPGMIFTIEPILCENSSKIAVSDKDNWSVFTLDGGSSSQFEHEVLITEHGAEIITLP